MKNSFLLILLLFSLSYCLKSSESSDNYIIAVYDIKKPQNARIINSYERVFETKVISAPFDDSYRNALQIEDCKISVNGKEIPYFSYNYDFPSEGLYTIKFEFNQLLESTVYMFYKTGANKIDLSHFNTKNVIYMNYMFAMTESLESINLDNLNTGNVVEMESMFRFSRKLKSIDLASFTTPNLLKISALFLDCGKLKTIKNLNLDTSKVSDFSFMFKNCDSLRELVYQN